MTGIGYDKTSLASAKIAAPASLVDLYAIDPKKLSFLSEARDTFGLGLLKLGKAADPADDARRTTCRRSTTTSSRSSAAA